MALPNPAELFYSAEGLRRGQKIDCRNEHASCLAFFLLLRLPETRWQVWLAGWSLAVMFASWFFIAV